MNSHVLRKNLFYLYVLTITKLLIPIAIMPYLSRVLSTEQYSIYSQVRACVTFINLFMDYGFIYTATKEISQYADDNKRICNIMSEITGAKLVLFAMILLFTALMLTFTKNFRGYTLYVLLTILAAGLINMLPDFLFRGLENMKLLSDRFLISKLITTALLLVMVKSEADFLYIAFLEMLCSVLALYITCRRLKKDGIVIERKHLFGRTFKRLKEGFSVFLTTVAPSAYGALNTLFVGTLLPAVDVVYWSISWSVISAGMNMYLPIVSAIFPRTVKDKNFRVIKKMLNFCIPVLLLICGAVIMLSDKTMLILGGTQYIKGKYTLMLLTPVLLFSFPGILVGFPVFGAVGSENKLRDIVVFSAVFHVAGLAAMRIFGRVTIVNVCLLRCATELFSTVLKLWQAKNLVGSYHLNCKKEIDSA